MPGLPSKMKASVKFRGEGQKPLLRVKAPIKFLGLPLFTGCAVGEKEELAVLVGTSLDVGPSVRLSYRPNEENTSSSVVVKAGLGPWFSPNSDFLSVSAEIDLNSEKNTRIMVKTSPRFGDFRMRRNGVATGNSEGVERENPKIVASKVEIINKISAKQTNGSTGLNGLNGLNGVNGVNGINGYPESNGKLENGHMGLSNGNGHIHEPGFPAAVNGDSTDNGTVLVHGNPGSEKRAVSSKKGPLSNLFKGTPKNTLWGPKPKEGIWALQVHSDLPLGFWGIASCRWGLSLPKDIFSGGFNLNGLNVFSGNGLPTLSLDKVTLQTGRGGQGRRGKEKVGGRHGGGGGGGGDPRKDLARLSDDVIALHAENYTLRKAMEDLKVEFSKAGKRGHGRTEMYGHEENLLRSQVFDEIIHDKNGKEARGGGKERKDFGKGETKKGENKKGGVALENKKVSVETKGQSQIELGEGGVGGGVGGGVAGKDVSKELQKAILSVQGST